jgi:hypothetical protein
MIGGPRALSGMSNGALLRRREGTPRGEDRSILQSEEEEEEGVSVLPWRSTEGGPRTLLQIQRSPEGGPRALPRSMEGGMRVLRSPEGGRRKKNLFRNGDYGIAKLRKVLKM